MLAEFHVYTLKCDGELSPLSQTTGTVVLNELTPRLAWRFVPRDDFKGNALSVCRERNPNLIGLA